MMKIIWLAFLFSVLVAQNKEMSALEIIGEIDKNMNAKTRVLTSKMIVHGRRSSRTIESKNWVMGIDQAFTEYLSPPREAGTKMLKLGDKLWTYSPQTDRVIQISGHMLRQSVMGSDMSYNDMMEDRPIEELYSANIQQSIEINEPRVTAVSVAVQFEESRNELNCQIQYLILGISPKFDDISIAFKP